MLKRRSMRIGIRREQDIMLDLYSKIVFSVIAAALTVIAWNGAGNPGAIAASGRECGSFSDPCYVKFDNKVTVELATPSRGLPITVENWPSR
jgi:hypothetical protein